MPAIAPKYLILLFTAGLLILVGTMYVINRATTAPEQLVEPAEVPFVEEEPVPRVEQIGTSVEGRSIEVHTFGSGEQKLLFVGGIHGGYEWNSVLLSYELIDHLTNNPSLVPESLTVSIVPVANPDGLFDVLGVDGRFTLSDVPEDEGTTGTGRFNANNVDLNRNFACKWQPESTWRGQRVSAGTDAFSEPEAAALRDYIVAEPPKAVAFFHSQSNAVYASECLEGVLPETRNIMNTYSEAAGYRAVDSFDAYEITGDAEGWLATLGIPAITVELSTHETIEWQKNLAGVLALFEKYTIAK